MFLGIRKILLWIGWFGETVTLPNRGTATRTVSAGLIISYISFDVSGILSKRHNLSCLFSGTVVWLGMT